MSQKRKKKNAGKGKKGVVLPLISNDRIPPGDAHHEFSTMLMLLWSDPEVAQNYCVL